MMVKPGQQTAHATVWVLAANSGNAKMLIVVPVPKRGSMKMNLPAHGLFDEAEHDVNNFTENSQLLPLSQQNELPLSCSLAPQVATDSSAS